MTEAMTIPDLETECPSCRGSGGEYYRRDGWEKCSSCDGAGYLPTESGKKILALMRHNFESIRRSVNTSIRERTD